MDVPWNKDFIFFLSVGFVTTEHAFPYYVREEPKNVGPEQTKGRSRLKSEACEKKVK